MSSPKSHVQLVGLPFERSVKSTVNELHADVDEALKSVVVISHEVVVHPAACRAKYALAIPDPRYRESVSV